MYALKTLTMRVNWLQGPIVFRFSKKYSLVTYPYIVQIFLKLFWETDSLQTLFWIIFATVEINNKVIAKISSAPVAGWGIGLIER